MATFILDRADVFPAGTLVTVYPQSGAPPGGQPGPPHGASATSATVASDGKVTFTGLSDNTGYVAYAGSPDRYIGFHTDVATAVASAAASLVGVTGRSYKIVSGVLRNGGASSYFQPIDDGTSHRPQNIDTVSTSSGASGVITVNYPTIAVQRVVALLAEPDEVYAAAGITLGCSVGTDHVDISTYRTRNFSDEIHYDGAAWVRSSGSTFSPFLVASFTAGVLRLTHADIGVNNPYAVSLTPAGTTYRTVINGTVSATEINLSFVDIAGAVVTTADTNMKVHVARPQFQPIQISPQSLAISSFPNSNIWLYGVFEV